MASNLALRLSLTGVSTFFSLYCDTMLLTGGLHGFTDLGSGFHRSSPHAWIKLKELLEIQYNSRPLGIPNVNGPIANAKIFISLPSTRCGSGRSTFGGFGAPVK